jgi:hypothetical protein
MLHHFIQNQGATFKETGLFIFLFKKGNKEIESFPYLRHPAPKVQTIRKCTLKESYHICHTVVFYLEYLGMFALIIAV